MAGCPQGCCGNVPLWATAATDNWYFQLWLHLQQWEPGISVQFLCCPTQLAPWRSSFCVINSNDIDLQIVHPPKQKNPTKNKNQKKGSSNTLSAFLLKDKRIISNKRSRKGEAASARDFCCCCYFQCFQRAREFLDDLFENPENCAEILINTQVFSSLSSAFSVKGIGICKRKNHCLNSNVKYLIILTAFMIKVNAWSLQSSFHSALWALYEKWTAEAFFPFQILVMEEVVLIL